MKILFLGGKAIGYGVLQSLLSYRDQKIVGVVSNKSDLTPAWFPSVKKLADINDIPYFTEEIPNIEYDWIVCAYYDKVLTQKQIKSAKLGAINVHMGLIQYYRGCYPTTFPIINNEDFAGVTIHEITENIDAGAVYCQATLSIDPSDTGQTLYYKCTGAGISIFDSSWTHIRDGKVKPKLVDLSKAYYYKRSDFPSLKIDKNWPEHKQKRYIRALTFPPFPKPYYE